MKASSLAVGLVYLAVALGSGMAATRNAELMGAEAALQDARDGDTVYFPAGLYSAPAGTVYVVRASVTITGDARGGAVLQNIRLITLAPKITILNLTMVEKDCYVDEQNIKACSPATPLITLGLKGYPIDSAELSGLKLQYTRAYTGIAMGYDLTQNVTVSNVTINDGDMSGITVYQGRNISMSGISVTGNSKTWVDDGIAITAYLGPIDGLRVNHSHATYTADLIGFGAQMAFPMSNISIEDSNCLHVWYCLLMKTDIAAQKAQSNQASIDGFQVRNLKSN